MMRRFVDIDPLQHGVPRRDEQSRLAFAEATVAEKVTKIVPLTISLRISGSLQTRISNPSACSISGAVISARPFGAVTIPQMNGSRAAIRSPWYRPRGRPPQQVS